MLTTLCLYFFPDITTIFRLFYFLMTCLYPKKWKTYWENYNNIGRRSSRTDWAQVIQPDTPLFQSTFQLWLFSRNVIIHYPSLRSENKLSFVFVFALLFLYFIFHCSLSHFKGFVLILFISFKMAKLSRFWFGI